VQEQFPPPRNPSENVDASTYPATHRLLRQHVDMQVADLRVLFQLPVDELDPSVGCNLTTAAMMLNVISGFSRWFFHTDEGAQIAAEEEGRRPLSRRRFLGFVEAYWPHIAPEPSSDEVARRLYSVRNSLAHDLGVGEVPEGEQLEDVRLAKRAFSLADVVDVERTSRDHHPLTKPVIEEREGMYVVHLIGVYWALHRMLADALRDHPDEIESTVAALAIPEIEVVDHS
jgi:hypothetical protein